MGHVSWLEAARFSFPEPRLQWIKSNRRSGIAPGPLTVAGPRRSCTGFRNDPLAYDLRAEDNRTRGAQQPQPKEVPGTAWRTHVGVAIGTAAPSV